MHSASPSGTACSRPRPPATCADPRPSLSAAASKGRTCNWPSAAERSTPRARPDVGTNTASDSDRKSGEPGVDAGRSRRATYTPRRSSMLALTKKRKWMPSGRKTGHRCEFSPRSKSTSVAGCTGPPSADTWARPSKIMSGPNTIVPVGLHAPPFPSGALQMTTGTPPATATFISLPREKYPSDMPSGDQNGCFAPLVPSITSGSRESSDHTNRRGVEPSLTAVNAIRRPFGDTIGAESSAVPAGSDQVNCVRSGATDGFGDCSRSRPPTSATRTIAKPAAPAMAQPRPALNIGCPPNSGTASPAPRSSRSARGPTAGRRLTETWPPAPWRAGG